MHEKVERMPFSQSLFKGELTDTQSIAYMVNQWFIFQAMEHNIFRHLPHSSLPRCDKISDCVRELGGKIDGDLMTQGTAKYINYIVGCEDDKDKWNSHVYLNYMAMLMGGLNVQWFIVGGTQYWVNYRAKKINVIHILLFQS